MQNEIKNPTFEQWIQHLFDHPVEEPAWYFNLDAPFFDCGKKPHRTVEFIYRLFETPSKYIEGYTDAQINQGLYMLISPNGSNHMFRLFEPRVSRTLRIQTVNAMFNMFEQVFLPRCSPHLSHLIYDESDIVGLNPLNSVCYMWWDIIPFYGNSGDPEREALDKSCLEVMRRTLDLDSMACRESALHGLGHWEYTHPEYVRDSVQGFLDRYSDISEPLRQYALDAHRGCVQ